MYKQPISYKDSSAFVIKKADGIYRYITRVYAKEYDYLMQSGLFDALVKEKLIVEHREVDTNFSGVSDNVNSIYKVIYPEQIKFISYPYEWSFSQRKDVIQHFLMINSIALRFGMILKDATPYNFSFKKNQCVLIDTTSFAFYKVGEPWLAYKQFCEEMLAPILLMKYRGYEWSKLYRTELTGMSLSFVSKQLPLSSYFNNLSLFHIHLHSLFQRKKSTVNNRKASNYNHKLNPFFALLKQKIEYLTMQKNTGNYWNKYYDVDIESECYIISKEKIISNWLSNIKASSVVDIGANNGRFSFLAKKYADEVYAIEADAACVDVMYAQNRKSKMGIHAILADVASPSPGLGWMNLEKASLLDRLSGNVIMALAIVHHLCITRNLPIEFVADLCRKITTKFAIVEFIPQNDSKVKILLANREDLFTEYTEQNFITSFSNYFKLIEEKEIEQSNRKLFLWEKR